jgi:integrase
VGIVRDRGRYYWVKRVPKRFAGLVRGADGQPVTQVRQALHTDSLPEAKLKGAQVEAARLAEWEAMAAGDAGSARKHYEAARKLAQARGFPYTPMSALTEGDVSDLMTRVLSLAENGRLTASPAATEAVLGAVPEALPTLPEVLAEYYQLTKTRHLKKSPAQRHKWKLPRERAVRNFVEVTGKGSVPVGEITRADALAFRRWWSTRVEGGMKVESANKDFGHLQEIFNTWSDLTNTEFANPFAKLRLDGRDEHDKPAFSREWVTTKILAPGALDSLNDEARDVFLITLNTGLRPSEITDAPLEDFETSANVPFLRVAAHGRELKVAHTRRDIPLLGVALEAAQRIVARGGMIRYRHKAGSWSACVNKFLAENGLKESPRHTAYSVRHYVENALLAAKVDDRVRADILGHKYHRPSYGDGGAMVGRRDALELIAV